MSAPIFTIVCRCRQAGKVPAEKVAQILASLHQDGQACLAVDDFCGWAAQRRAELQQAAAGHTLRLIGCQPRALRWLADWAGLSATVCLEAAAVTPADLGLSTFVENNESAAEDENTVDSAAENGWVPWFPVIDRDRCTNCGKCVAFCLFGVYSRGSSGEPLVTAPASCKNNCPACARSCPQQAIIFPKYAHSPINGGMTDGEPSGEEPVLEARSGFAAQLRRRRPPTTGEIFRD